MDSSCVDFLAQYPHPAFILTASNQAESDLELVYANRSFARHFNHAPEDCQRDFTYTFHLPSQREEFKQWILHSTNAAGFTVEVNGTSGAVPLDVTKTKLSDFWVCTTVPRIPLEVYKPHAPKEVVIKEAVFTFSRTSTDTYIPVAELVETIDWSSTLLGPREEWPQVLESIFRMMLSAPFPVVLCWGKDWVHVYNDAYAKVMIGKRHPQVFGKSLKDEWADILEFVSPTVESAYAGITTSKVDDLMFLEKGEHNLPQEFYLTWHFLPIWQEDGTVGGFFDVSTDTTDTVIAARRARGFYKLVTQSVLATSISEFNDIVIRILSHEDYSYDVPFALVYVPDPDQGADRTTSTSTSLLLGGSIAVPHGHPSAPQNITVRLDEEEEPENPSSHHPGFTAGDTAQQQPTLWPFAEAIRKKEIVHMQALPKSMIDGFERRGWGDEPREAIVIPIGFSDQRVPRAILIMGINTRRPYDETYREHAEILRGTLSSTLHAIQGRQAEIERARHLAELDEVKMAFFTNVSHEFRTPLTLISGPLEQSISTVPEGLEREQLKLAQHNINRLTRLVDSLMDIGKLSAQSLKGQFQPTQLGLYTSRLALLFGNLIERKGLTYRSKCDLDPSQPLCYVDPELWEKIVFNLIGNAFKYTLEGFINISLVHTRDEAILTVQDSGIGIPEGDISKIFDRFYRAKTTSRSHEGTGIGLSLTKELIGLHGGTLLVESNNNPDGAHGSKFVAKIPLGKDHLPPDDCVEIVHTERDLSYGRKIVEEASEWAVSPSIATEGQVESRPSTRSVVNQNGQIDQETLFFEKTDVVLFVDDNAGMRKYVKSLLDKYCTVIEASNGREALELALEKRPDIVLSDLMMPVMGGYRLLKELRGRPETKLIPVILVTAKSGDHSRVEGLLSGADDYLPKPFKSSELIARVHLQMQLGKRRIEMEEKFNQRTKEIQQLSQMAPVAIFRKDEGGKITYVNPRWYEITGQSLDDDPNDWFQKIHHEHKTAVSDWWVTPATRQPLEFRWNTDKWCQAQQVLVEGGMMGVFVDISERKELEEMARREAKDAEARRQEAEERRRNQELLIDVTSHELRQPVSAILNCALIVRDNLLSLRDSITNCQDVLKVTPSLLQVMQEDLEALDAIYQCGLTQERIANDVLSLSKIQLGVFNIQTDEFDLVDEVNRILSLFRNEAQMKKIYIQCTFGSSLEAFGISRIFSDKTRFAQVITNLLSNAIKFTNMNRNERLITLHLDVRLDPPSNGTCQPPTSSRTNRMTSTTPHMPIFLYISVTDSGPGLNPEDLALLFQRFQQGSNSRHVFGGSGLGLFVSRLLCELMGGRIEVLSTLGQGAMFRFFIQATVAPPKPKPLLSSSQLVVSTPARPLQILITEDNLINQSVLNRQLTKAGHSTLLAENGREAIDIVSAADETLDVILMDVEMPILDGLSAVREIRRMEGTGKLHRRHYIIALTGNARDGQIQVMRESGMDDVVIKPYNVREILDKLCCISPGLISR